jgi:serine/threonine protein kinase
VSEHARARVDAVQHLSRSWRCALARWYRTRGDLANGWCPIAYSSVLGCGILKEDYLGMMGRAGARARSRQQQHQAPPAAAVLKIRRASRMGTHKVSEVVTSRPSSRPRSECESGTKRPVGWIGREAHVRDQQSAVTAAAMNDSTKVTRQRTIPEILEQRIRPSFETPRLELPRLDMPNWSAIVNRAQRMTPETVDTETPAHSGDFSATPLFGELGYRDPTAFEAGAYRTPTYTVATAANANWLSGQPVSIGNEDSNGVSAKQLDQNCGANQPPPSPSPALKRLHLMNGSSTGRWHAFREQPFSALRPPLCSQRPDHASQTIPGAEADSQDNLMLASQMNTQNSLLSQDTLGMLRARRRAIQSARQSNGIVGRITFSQAGDDEGIAQTVDNASAVPLPDGVSPVLTETSHLRDGSNRRLAVPDLQPECFAENFFPVIEARIRQRPEAEFLAAMELDAQNRPGGNARWPAFLAEQENVRAVPNRNNCVQAKTSRGESRPASCEVANPFLTRLDGLERDTQSAARSDAGRGSHPVLEAELAHSHFFRQFEELRVLGSGIKGHVLLVRDRVDGFLYAVKRSTRPLLTRTDRQDALREVHALSAIGYHENIVRYHTAWFEDQHTRLYIQLEFCNGGNLRVLSPDTGSEKPLSSSYCRLIRLMGHVASALAHCHARGIAHMDVKPENILVSRGQHPVYPNQSDEQELFKLGDFGLACRSDGTDFNGSEGDARYLCQSVLREATSESLALVDVFALGISVYELLTQQPLPTQGEEWHDLRNGKLVLLERFRQSTFVSKPESVALQFLSDWIERCMNPMLGERPTAKQVAEACVQWLRDHNHLVNLCACDKVPETETGLTERTL